MLGVQEPKRRGGEGWKAPYLPAPPSSSGVGRRRVILPSSRHSLRGVSLDLGAHSRMRPWPKIGPRNPATYLAYINHTFSEKERDFRLFGEVEREGRDQIGSGAEKKEGRREDPRETPTQPCGQAVHFMPLVPRPFGKSVMRSMSWAYRPPGSCKQ